MHNCLATRQARALLALVVNREPGVGMIVVSEAGLQQAQLLGCWSPGGPTHRQVEPRTNEAGGGDHQDQSSLVPAR